MAFKNTRSGHGCCGLWANEKIYKAETLQGASLHQYVGPRNFVHLNWSTDWAFISNFPEKVWNFSLFVIRLLAIFFRFQENIQQIKI